MSMPENGGFRSWGIVVTTFYAAVLLLLIVPFTEWAAVGGTWNSAFTLQFLAVPVGFIWLLVLLTGQALLLFVSVDTSFRRTRPRRHLAVSIAAVSAAVVLLTLGIGLSLVAAIGGDEAVDTLLDETGLRIVLTWLVIWLVWGAVFYLHRDAVSPHLDRSLTWLIRGSVLELLVAVPCHVIVRQREDCSAPSFTAFGIATGIAIMLMAFGPGVLALYQKRLRAYPAR